MKWMLYFLGFCLPINCMESDSVAYYSGSSVESIEHVDSKDASDRIINLYFNGNRKKIRKRIGPKLAERLNNLQDDDLSKIVYLRDLCDMCDHDEENPLPITRSKYIEEHRDMFDLCETHLTCAVHDSLKEREAKIKSEERKKRYAMIAASCSTLGTCLGITATLVTAILAITGNTACFST